jgi:hypothetical protein
MKMNKWTLGLAAVGLVSLASVARAEEKTTTPVLTALSSTQISGYVDVSAQWNPGTGTVGPGFAFNGPTKRDGFNVNSVLVTIEKPLEEGQWSAGYHVDLMYGPDSVAVTADPDIRQAYVALRAPVGNGLDFKVGRWDTILGYESSDGYKNPNFTRSYGYTIEPTEHTGILATYQAADFLALNAGVANTLSTLAINARSGRSESHKAYMGSIALTAPESFGSFAGSALTIGVIDGFGGAKDQTSYYAGATVKTPIEALSLGASWDFVDDPATGGPDTYAVAAYASFKVMEKLGLNLRGEYARGALGGFAPAGTVNPGKVLALTGTVQYDLWENVISRLEVRWDHSADSTKPYSGKTNDYLVALNLVYKF